MSGVVGLLATGAVSNLVSPVINRLLELIPNPEKRAEEAAAAATALVAADQALLAQQNAINLQEAKSENLFVSGWRPFIGWSCGAALLWQVETLPRSRSVGGWPATSRILPKPPATTPHFRSYRTVRTMLGFW